MDALTTEDSVNVTVEDEEQGVGLSVEWQVAGGSVLLCCLLCGVVR